MNSTHPNLFCKLLTKSINILLHPQYHKYNIARNTCNLCNRKTIFVCDEPQDKFIRRCIWCRSTPKYRAIFYVVEKMLGQPLANKLLNADFKVYELSTTSPIFRRFNGLPNYYASGYFPDKDFKSELIKNVFNQNLEDLSFLSSSFDLIISSQTMEHVPNHDLAFKEIYRVLKPGGFHCFTIPYYANDNTKTRARIINGNTIHDLPQKTHKDPYCPEGCLVYTDFGRDIVDKLNNIGYITNRHEVLDDISDIQDDLKPVHVFTAQRPG